MTWQARVQAALDRLTPEQRAWLDRLPGPERVTMLRLLVEFDAEMLD